MWRERPSEIVGEGGGERNLPLASQAGIERV